MIAVENSQTRVEFDIIEPAESWEETVYRFWVFEQTEAGEWEQVDGASYDTRIKVGVSDYIVMKAAVLVLTKVMDAPGSVKKVARELSWMDESWFEEVNHG